MRNFFGVGGSSLQEQVPQASGTAIGDMSAGGGLAAAFDGNIDQSGGASAQEVTSDESFIGKDWGAGTDKIISGFKAWGSNDNGYVANINPTITITLQGSTDNFSSSIVDLGNASATDANSLNIIKLTDITATTPYRYHRLKITHGGGAANNMYCAEVEFFEEH